MSTEQPAASSSTSVLEEEAQLVVWAVIINRPVTREEFTICFNNIDKKSRSKAERYPNRGDAFRYVLSKIIAPLVLWNRYPDLPPSHWRHNVTKAGKEFMDSPTSTKVLGYDTARGESLVVMAYGYGRKSAVVNVGVDIMKLSLPRGVTARRLGEAYSHKLTKNEAAVLLSKQLKDEVVLRRLSIVFTLKTAYIKALGQPTGFDFSRIECNIPEETVTVDGNILKGWEFRLFKANLGVLRNALLQEETYQCTCAIYRGGEETKFIWEENPKEMEKWLHFINTDMVLENVKTKTTLKGFSPNVVPSPPLPTVDPVAGPSSSVSSSLRGPLSGASGARMQC